MQVFAEVVQTHVDTAPPVANMQPPVPPVSQLLWSGPSLALVVVAPNNSLVEEGRASKVRHSCSPIQNDKCRQLNSDAFHVNSNYFGSLIGLGDVEDVMEIMHPNKSQ